MFRSIRRRLFQQPQAKALTERQFGNFLTGESSSICCPNPKDRSELQVLLAESHAVPSMHLRSVKRRLYRGCRRSGRVGGAAASDGRSSELRDEQQAKQRLPSPPVDWQPEEEHCRQAHTAAHGEGLLQRVVERSGGWSRGVDG
jgi:hypothetical protein